MQFGSAAEGLLVAFQRNNHVLFVVGISVQHFILRDQTARALGKKHLVTELDRGLHLATLDEVGMGLENRIELLGRWNLLAIEYTPARLIYHASSEIAKMLDLLARLRDSQIADHICATRFVGLPERGSCAFDDLLGTADEFAVSPGLLLLALS
jgi:hypothetical protein